MEKTVKKLVVMAVLLITAQAVLLLMQMTEPVAAATLAKDPYIVLTGWATSPACPSGWTEVVADTAAGTIAPLTSITANTQLYMNDGTSTALFALGSGGPGSAVTIPAASAATTYTWKYRVCSKN